MTDPTPAVWLDRAVVESVIGDNLTAGVDDTDALDEHTDAVRSWVEDRRKDLLQINPDDVDGDLVFTPPVHVKVAAAMLAYRLYQNRRKPDEEIGDAPELRAMLGIGRAKGLRFGGAAVPVEVAS